ncbi:MAG: phosphotransferase [Candidatus Promineifilaceae bacterium]|nr:phosphotransferase [Candidatus Promineifilaceae bacterium]
MEKEIRRRFNDAILNEAKKRYGIADEKIRLLDGFESYIFEFENHGGSYILRISHSIRRTREQIEGEVDWINYLADGGLGVARAIPSQQKALVEVIEDGRDGQFLAAAFSKAPGGSAWSMNMWNEQFFPTYGRFMGRLHALSREYQLPNPNWKRPEWDDHDAIGILHWLPDAQALIKERSDALLGHLRSLPKDDDSYGLIHQDAHGGNFFVDDQRNITLFDFDDCVYSWYVYDVAMVLFYAVTNHPDPEGFGALFWSHFWPAYRAQFDLDSRWLEQMPAFFKLREIDLYAAIHRSFDVENLTDPWVAKFMDGRRERIERDMPYLDLEFRPE